MRKLFRFVMILLICFGARASACEYCFVSEHGYVFDMNRTLLRVDVRYQSFSGLTGISPLVDNVTTEHISTYFTVNYGTGRWGATVVLPHVYRNQANTFTGTSSLHYHHTGGTFSAADSASADRNTTRGLGDMSLLLRYALLATEGDQFISVFAQLGAKLPTGRTDARDRFGYLMHPHLQSGSGTTLGLLGLSGAYGGFRSSFSASILFGIPLATRGVFREASTFIYDLAFRYRLFPEDPEEGAMLVQTLGFVGRISGKELYDGKTITDSGGHLLVLNAGLSFFPLPELSFDIAAQLPLLKNLTGNQLDEQIRLTSGVQIVL